MQTSKFPPLSLNSVMTPKVSPVVFFFLFFLFLLPFSFHARLSSSSYGKRPSPFEFIKDLQGCHKEDNVKGIIKLKKYLEQFGYLSYSHSKNHPHANDDDFDELLECAIKTYQTNYRLKVSGNLDAATVSEMLRPRCGVADIINGTNWMRSGKKRHDHHGHGSLHTVAHYSFFPRSPRWPPSKTPSDICIPLAQAFDEWASATHFQFTQTQHHSNADMKIGFHRRNHGDSAPFDGPGGVIAHAFAPTDGRLHYDVDERFELGAVPGAYDLKTVALHEISHLLGLGHISVTDTIMFASISPGVTKGLYGDDIQGIKVLFNKA